MDHHLHDPSHFDTDRDSFPGFQPWSARNTKGFDVKNKRKMSMEQLSLPTPKLPCLASTSFSFPYGDNFNKKPQEEEEEEESNVTNMSIEEEEVKEVQRSDGIKLENETLQQNSYGHEEDLLELFGSHENSCIIDDNDQPCCSDTTTAQSLLFPPTHSKNDFVLSSGRWSMHSHCHCHSHSPEAASESTSIKKPTIDEEFEEYFSMLLP